MIRMRVHQQPKLIVTAYDTQLKEFTHPLQIRALIGKIKQVIDIKLQVWAISTFLRRFLFSRLCVHFSFTSFSFENFAFFFTLLVYFLAQMRIPIVLYLVICSAGQSPSNQGPPEKINAPPQLKKPNQNSCSDYEAEGKQSRKLQTKMGKNVTCSQEVCGAWGSNLLLDLIYCLSLC